MVDILGAVLTDGLGAVEAPCAEALSVELHSSDVILYILARRRDASAAISVRAPAALRLRHEPTADCARYGSLRRAIHAKGAKLIYLPPYSPDLNPIELLFDKLKALLRKAAGRSISPLWTRIGKLADQLSADECRHYLAHAGNV
jgi:transposase